MNNRIKFLSVIALLFIFDLSYGQVKRIPLVEHFTNTKCSVCASRNPGFYSNLSKQGEVNYISIHPSSPYSSCPLSKQNSTKNDARTRMYNVYGGTPRLVINGTVLSPIADYSSSGIFNPYQGKNSAFNISFTSSLYSDSVQIELSVKKVDTSSLDMANLYLALVEDTVFVNGGNGEREHFNVLRNNSTKRVALPKMNGDSTLFSFTLTKQNYWDINRIKGIAVLQNSSNNEMIQSASGAYVMEDKSTGLVKDKNELNFTMYPNPASKSITINSDQGQLLEYSLIQIDGTLVLSGALRENNQIDVSNLNKGMYIIKVLTNTGQGHKILSIK